jgi:uncharacterized protein
MAAPAAAAPGTTSAASLCGSQCPECGVVVYPEGAGCPRCGRDMVARALSAQGVLWTWTVQRFAPKSPPYQAPPEGFRPFAVGYVELPEGVRVQAVLDVDDLASVRIGMPLRLVCGGGVPRFAAVPCGAGDR